MADLKDKVKTKDIDGHEIAVTPFLGFRSLEYKARLLKVLGPGARGLFSGIKAEDIESLSNGESSILDTDIGMIGEVIEHLTKNLNEKQFAQLCLDILQSTRIDGREINKEAFDLEFMGNLLFMYKILFFAIMTNWGDFFGQGGFGRIAKRLKSKDQTTPKSPESQNQSIQR